jgi:dTDP-4-amino-4,6-dideoxygalactose transaminase
MNPLYKQLEKKLDNTEILNETALSIPLHPRLTDEEVDYIIDEIKYFLK